MKKIVFLICTAILSISTFASNSPKKATVPNTEKFTIKGKIDGLSKGDTLSFQSVTMPYFKINPGFDVIVGDKGSFSYKGTQPHSFLYIMIYKPLSGKAPSADRMGREIFITAGDKLTLSGNRQFYAFCQIEGGIYNNSLLRQAVAIDDSLGMIRTQYSQKIDEARIQNDKEAIKKYTDAFNNFYDVNKKPIQKARSLWDKYYTDASTSELTAFKLLQSHYSGLEYLTAHWDKIPTTVKESYHGKLLDSIIGKMDSLQTGKQAIDFTLSDSTGHSVSLSDFHGKYLLIYHWGMCPGSMQADPIVKDLYAKTDRSKVEIIGVSSSIAQVKALKCSASPTESIYGMNLSERLESMTTHPYPDFDLNIKGNDISERYMFGGLPYFVFISPEGKIIALGFQEALFDARKMLLTEKK